MKRDYYRELYQERKRDLRDWMELVRRGEHPPRDLWTQFTHIIHGPQLDLIRNRIYQEVVTPSFIVVTIFSILERDRESDRDLAAGIERMVRYVYQEWLRLSEEKLVKLKERIAHLREELYTVEGVLRHPDWNKPDLTDEETRQHRQWYMEYLLAKGESPEDVVLKAYAYLVRDDLDRQAITSGS